MSRVWFIGAALGALLFLTAAAPPPAPQRVMSLNMCTDALVLDLLPSSRIASVTYLSRATNNSLLWQKARQTPINYGTAEEVLAQKPDLVIAGTYTASATRALLRQLGVPMIEVPPASDFFQIRQITRQVAAAVGETARGERLLHAMDENLTDLANTAPRTKIRVAAWGEGGIVPGKDSLFDAVLAVAGGANVATSLVPGRGWRF